MDFGKLPPQCLYGTSPIMGGCLQLVVYYYFYTAPPHPHPQYQYNCSHACIYCMLYAHAPPHRRRRRHRGRGRSRGRAAHVGDDGGATRGKRGDASLSSPRRCVGIGIGAVLEPSCNGRTTPRH